MDSDSHIHLIGIGGTGMSAIARVLVERGYTVSGSDRQLSPLAKDLISAGVQIAVGHRAENIQGADLIVRSSAIPAHNPEIEAALQAGIPVLRRQEFLGILLSNNFRIAVAGTHGKTTTTAMIAWMLVALGADPGYIIGGVSKNLGNNSHAGKSRLFVIEADEYDRMFLGLHPQVAVITNVEHDHPDSFPTPEDYHQAFLEFANQVSDGGRLFICLDDPGAERVYRKAVDAGKQVLGYGLNSFQAVYQGKALKLNEMGGYDFGVFYLPPEVEGIDTAVEPLKVSLQVPGEHNVRNALAAIAVAHYLELPLDEAAGALSEFTGTGRRFDVIGEPGGVTIINDYGHHPTEIKTTLAAARSRYPDREIWAVWQPHTFSRTRSLLREFAAAFRDANHAGVVDIYASREPVDPTFSAADVVAVMDHPDAHYLGSVQDAGNYLLTRLKPGDVLLVFSAGDADQITSYVLSALQERKPDNAENRN